MKLQYLAVFVSTMVMAGTASAAEVYNKNGNKLDLFGKINGMRYLSSDESKNRDNSFAQLGLKVETQISDGLVGFGSWEYEMSAYPTEIQNTKNNLTRLGFAGLKFGDMGSVDYGRNYGVLYDVGAWTDVIPEFGGDVITSNNIISNSVLTYRNKNFFGIVDGINIALQYQGKNDDLQNGNLNVKEVNGDSYGLSLIYDLGNGVSAGVAYAKNNLTSPSLLTTSRVEKQDKKTENYSLGLKYDANSLYLAALYGRTYNILPCGEITEDSTKWETYSFAEKAKNIELVAQYQFDSGLRPSLGYLQSKIDYDNQGQSKNRDLKKYIEIGASHNFNKNMVAFIDYRINLLSKNDLTDRAQISTDNVIAIGMTYMF